MLAEITAHEGQTLDVEAKLANADHVGEDFERGGLFWGRYLYSLLVLFTLSLDGCGIQLVTREPEYSKGWHQYVTPRAPKNAVEEGVLKVAATRKDREVAGQEIHFIVTDTTRAVPVQCVVVVGKSPGARGPNDRKVTRYRVYQGQISAMSDTMQEFFLDPEMERAILRAASDTWAENLLRPYQNGEYTLATYSRTNCSVMVRIYKGNSASEHPIAEKTVYLCFAR